MPFHATPLLPRFSFDADVTPVSTRRKGQRPPPPPSMGSPLSGFFSPARAFSGAGQLSRGCPAETLLPLLALNSLMVAIFFSRPSSPGCCHLSPFSLDSWIVAPSSRILYLIKAGSLSVRCSPNASLFRRAGFPLCLFPLFVTGPANPSLLFFCHLGSFYSANDGTLMLDPSPLTTETRAVLFSSRWALSGDGSLFFFVRADCLPCSGFSVSDGCPVR